MKTFKFRPRSMDELRAQAIENGMMDPARMMAEGVQPRPVNVREVLDLGALVFFRWRGRSYGVPPLPWKEGAALLDAFLEAQNLGESITEEAAPRYYRTLRTMSRIMWRNTRPVGFLRRALKRLRILRNPYAQASEREIGDLAVFFLGCRTRVNPEVLRMRAGVGGPSPMSRVPTTS